MKQKLLDMITQSPRLRRLSEDRTLRTVMLAALSMGWNLLYALFNGVLGMVYGSVWFFVLCVYYLILGLMRLSVVSYERNLKDARRTSTVLITQGITLIVLALSLTGVTYLRIGEAKKRSYGTIMMITIAAITFTMLTVTVINTVRAHRMHSDTMILLRNISCAGAVGSVLSLEHAMLGTFGELSDSSSFAMEVASGAGAFLIICALGISVIVRGIKHKSRP